MEPDETSFTGKANKKNKRGFKFKIEIWDRLISVSACKSYKTKTHVDLHADLRANSENDYFNPSIIWKVSEKMARELQDTWFSECSECKLPTNIDLNTISAFRICGRFAASKVHMYRWIPLFREHNSQSQRCYSMHALSRDHIRLILTCLLHKLQFLLPNSFNTCNPQSQCLTF